MRNKQEFLNKMLKEKKKHRENVSNILEEEGYIELLELNRELKSVFQDINVSLNNLDGLVNIVIENFISYSSRKTINKDITIRDGSIYRYNSSKEASIYRISKNAEKITDAIEDEEDRDIVHNILETIRPPDTQINLCHDVNGFPYFTKTGGTYIFYDCYGSRTSYNGSMSDLVVYKQDGYDNADKAYNDLSRYLDSIELNSMKRDIVESVIPHVDEVMELLEDVLEELKERRDSLKETEQKIENEYSEIIVAKKI